MDKNGCPPASRSPVSAYWNSGWNGAAEANGVANFSNMCAGDKITTHGQAVGTYELNGVWDHGSELLEGSLKLGGTVLTAQGALNLYSSVTGRTSLFGTSARSTSTNGFSLRSGYSPSDDIIDFANRYEPQLNAAAANRMRQLGIPEESIGLRGTPFDQAFETRIAQGGSNLHPDWSNVQTPVINVDIGVLDSTFSQTSTTWATASWKDRIDAVIAHEWTEVSSSRMDAVILRGESFSGRHVDALRLAPETPMQITPTAKQILSEDRRFWLGE